MSTIKTYRGCTLTPNFSSINGTGHTLKSQRGWNVTLPGYGSLGWTSSFKDAQRSIDLLYAGDCNDKIRRVLAAISKAAA